MINLSPFILSFKLAIVTTVILFIISVPLAWSLSQTKSVFKPFLEAIFALPIVLPPSVIGFYVIVILAPDSPLGGFLKSHFDIELLFTFWGLVVASVFYSFPFMLQPLQSGFESLKKEMIEASFICGKGSWTTLYKVALPNIKPSIMSAIVITFAHTIGEFGVVLMVGGSIDDKTKVASVAIYEFVETMDYEKAHIYSGIMLLLSFIILIFVYRYRADSDKN